MKRLWCATGLALSVWAGLAADACCAAAGALSVQEKNEGWKMLWDGKTAEGWRGIKSDAFPTSGWDMADGVLTVLPKAAGGGAGDIITREKFANFILTAEFRLTAGANSGIKYLYDPEVSGGTTLEYQVLDESHPDAAKGRDGNRKVASFYDVMPAAGAQPKPVGEWNAAMIVCRGSHVEHWLNGKRVLAFERGSEAFRAAVAQSKFSKYPNWGEQAAGHILLQDHQDKVSYRNIKIKVLE